MFTTPEDWLDRFKAEGFVLTLDASGIRPSEGEPPSPACMTIWNEIRGLDNKGQWDEVVALVREKVGPFTGWTEY